MKKAIEGILNVIMSVFMAAIVTMAFGLFLLTIAMIGQVLSGEVKSGYYNKQYCPNATYRSPDRTRAVEMIDNGDINNAVVKAAVNKANAQLPLVTVASTTWSASPAATIAAQRKEQPCLPLFPCSDEVAPILAIN